MNPSPTVNIRTGCWNDADLNLVASDLDPDTWSQNRASGFRNVRG